MNTNTITATGKWRSWSRQTMSAAAHGALPDVPTSASANARIEPFEIVHTLTHADPHDREPEVPGDRNDDPALRSAVELRENDRVERQRPIELARLHESVLTRRRVHDEHRPHRERALTLGYTLDLHQFRHEVSRRVEPARGIDQDHVGLPMRAFAIVSNTTAAGSDPCGRSTTGTFARSAQTRSCSIAAARNVSPEPITTRPPRLGQALGELPHARRLAGPVDAHHEDGRFGDGERVLAVDGHLGGDLFGKPSDHRRRVGKRLARGQIAQPLDHLGGRCDAHVRLKERVFEFFPEDGVEVRAAAEQHVQMSLELASGLRETLTDAPVPRLGHDALAPLAARSSFWLTTLLTPSACIETP